MVNRPEHNALDIKVKNQVVYLDGNDVGFFEVHDGSKVRAVLGPNQDSLSGYWSNVPEAIEAILRYAMSGEYDS